MVERERRREVVAHQLAEQEAIRDASRQRARAAKSHPPRRMTRLRLVLLSILFALAPIAVFVQAEARDRTRAHVVGSMSAALGKDFAYGDIDLSNLPAGGLSIGSLSWGGATSVDPMFEVARVSLGFETSVLLRGEVPRLSVVQLEGAKMRFHRDGDGLLNVTDVLRDRAAGMSDAEQRTGALPDIIQIRQGALEFMDDSTMREPIVLSGIDLELCRELNGVSGTFQLSGEVNDPDWGNWSLSGVVSQQSEGMRIEELQISIKELQVTRAIERYVDPSVLAPWRALEPRGAIRQLQVTVDRNVVDQLRAHVEVDASELRIALLETALGQSIGNLVVDLLLGGDEGGLQVHASAHAGVAGDASASQQQALVSLRGHLARGVDRHGELDVELAHLAIASRLPGFVAELGAFRGRMQAAAPATDATQGDLAERLERLALGGQVSLSAHLDLPGNGRALGVTGRIELEDVSLVVPGSVEDLVADQIKGTLQFDGANFRSAIDGAFTGRIDGLPARVASVRCNDLFSREDRSYEILVEMPAIPVAGSPVLARVEQAVARSSADGEDSKFLLRLRESALDGLLDLSISTRGGGPLAPRTTELRVNSAAGLRLAHAGLPCVVMLEHGRVVLSQAPNRNDGQPGPRLVELLDLRGSTPFGTLTGHGAIRPGEGSELTLSCERLTLAPDLHAGAPTWAVRAWDALRLEHTLGIATKLEWQGGQFAASIDARGATMSPLGIPLANVAGVARWDGRELRIAQFSGDGLGGRLEASSGRVVRDPAGDTIDLQLAGRGLDLWHPAIARMIGGAANIRDLHPKGSADISCTVAARSWDPRTVQIESRVAVPRLELHGQLFEDVRCTVQVDRGVIAVSDVRSRLFGGNVLGEARIATGARPTYQGSLQLQGIQVDPLLVAAGLESNPQSTGLLDAQLTWSGVCGSLELLKAEGSLRTHSGPLYKMPARLARMDGKSPDGSPTGWFKEASADFAIEGRELIVLSSCLRGEKVGLHGFGACQLGGDLDLDIYVGGTERQQFARALRSAPVGFHVSGTFDESRMDMTILPGLGALLESLRDFLAGDKPTLDQAGRPVRRR